MAKSSATSRFPPNTASHMLTIPFQIPLSSGLQCKLFPAPHHHPVRMITMRAQLAPALLLLLVLLAAAAALEPALTPQEIRDRKINGANKMYIMSANPEAIAGEKKSAPESKEEPPKDAVQKTSYVMGAGTEPKPESKSDEKVLETKINAEVKQMRKEAAHDDAVAEEKAKEFKSKPKNTTDDAEDHAKEKKSKSKLDYSEDADGEKKEKKPKNKDDDSQEKKSKSKSEDDDDDEKKEKKSKSKEEDSTDDSEEKKVKSKDDDDEKKEKKSKSKEEDSNDDSEEKKSKIKNDASGYPGAEKKSKEKSESSEDAGEKKKSKSKNKEEDFDAVPMETKADESMPAADTPDGYAAPAKKTPPRLPEAANGYKAPTTTMSAADTPDGFLPPKMSAADTPDGYAAPTTMSAADTPDGYVTPSKAKPAMSAADTPDGYVTPSKAKPAMSAADTPEGYVPATDSPDGNVPASDSPDGYAAPLKKPKVNVQSFEDMVPRPVLDMLSPVVRSLCAKTRFPYTCETSIAKLPETTIVPARQKDGLGVLNLAIDAVRAKIREATTAAKDLTTDPRMDPITKSAIKDCITLYDDVKTSYDTGLAALKRGDKSTATTAFDAARTYVDTCDNGFLDRPSLKPVIAGQEKILAELSSNVLAINKYM